MSGLTRTVQVGLIMLLLACTSAVAQVTPTTPNPTARTKTGSITGTVVNENGQPLPNVYVYVRTFSSLRPVQSASSDSDGKFEVNGLEPLTYQIFARHNVYTLLSSAEGAPNNHHIGESVRLVMVKGGVITGTVTTQSGEPVVGVKVRVTYVQTGATVQERMTDDRGVYRAYGLPSGKYVVWAGGSAGGGYANDPFDADVPTYAPASTRELAAEITVRAGEETQNVDIRYRGEQGRTVSGIVSNPLASSSGVLVSLTPVVDGRSEMNVAVSQPADTPGFVFYGVDDGEYTVLARTLLTGSEWAVSAPKRISVRGSNVSGIELTLTPLASVSGQVVLEELKTKECTTRDLPLITETLVSAWHKQDEAAKSQPSFLWGLGTPANADERGNVKLQNIAPGDYYFVTRFASKTWYLQSISIASPATRKTVDATHVWTTVRNGDRISGLKITLAEGAASIAGQIALAEGEALPEKLFVYVVPAEKEKVDEVLRFYATAVNSEGKITLTNIAPGRYWLLARPAVEGGLTKLRLPDETESRAKLRREAEAGKTEIELKPCQNVVDYRLKLAAQ